MLWFLVILVVLTGALVWFMIRWAKNYLAQPFADASSSSITARARAAATGTQRVFDTNKGPRVFNVDIHGLPIVRRTARA